MNSLFYRVTNIAWALWFGGILALLIFVQALFRTDRTVTVSAAPHLFAVFERYEMGLAGVALVAIVAGWVRARSLRSALLPILLLIALALALVSTTAVTPEINRLRAANETHGTAFSRAHGISMLVYTARAVSLLLAGIVMSSPLSHGSNRRAAEHALVAA